MGVSLKDGFDKQVKEKIARYAEGRDLWTGKSLTIASEAETEFQPQIDKAVFPDASPAHLDMDITQS